MGAFTVRLGLLVGALPIFAVPIARADGPAAPNAATTLASEEVVAGQEGVFRLRGGGTVAGTVISRGPTNDVLRLRSGQEIVLPAGSLVARVGGFAGPDEVSSKDARRVRLLLRDGSTVEGELVARSASALTVRVDGQERTFVRSDIRGVFEYASLLAHRGGPPDAAGLRYVHATAAGRLEAEDLVVEATAEGLALGYGLTGWLSGSAALSTPLWWNGRSVTPDVVLGGDVHAALRPWLRASAGLRGQLTQRGDVLWAEGALTLGSDDVHGSLFAGPPVAGAGRLGALDGSAVGLALSGRFAARLGGVVEVFTSLRGDHTLAGAGALRLVVAPAWAVELGALGSQRGALPWFAVTFRRDGGVP